MSKTHKNGEETKNLKIEIYKQNMTFAHKNLYFHSYVLKPHLMVFAHKNIK